MAEFRGYLNAADDASKALGSGFVTEHRKSPAWLEAFECPLSTNSRQEGSLCGSNPAGNFWCLRALDRYAPT
jgi:hypothetical protein